MRFILAIALCLAAAAPAIVQSLTPDQLRAMIDERVASLDPYRKPLSDPDPERGMAAMQIMMESDGRS